MKGGTLFSGIGAPECAATWVDWRWCAEIEPFPSAVHAHHFPHVPNLGDVTKVDWDAVEPVDLLVAGSPCQSFSVAGKRLGLDDPRGNLALVTLAIARRLRVRWLVFENVPGLLSSDGGRDFGAFLGLLGECGYRWAYRVLDAQHFGVPQRRRRVIVVGCLGDWANPAAVLFEPHCLQGHPAPRREAGKGVAAPIAAGSPSGSGYRNDADTAGNLIPAVAMCLNAKGGSGRIDGESETFVATTLRARDGTKGVDSDCTDTLIAHTLRGEGFDASEDGTGRGTPLVPVSYRTAGDGAVYAEGDCTAPLTTGTDPSAQLVAYQCHGSNIGPIGTLRTGMNEAQGVPFVAFSCKDYGAVASDISPTLRAMGHGESHANAGGQVAVAWALNSHAGAADGDQTNRSHANGGPVGLGVSENVAYALRGARTQNVGTASAVRRLTPTECERLQGFPDGWTAIQYRGKPAADGPRYKALGNSMAVPVMRWVLDRVRQVDAIARDARRNAA